MPGKRIEDLPDHTVQGLWEAHRGGVLALEDAVDNVIVRAAGVLANKGYWMWTFTAASDGGSSWCDLHGDYWVVDAETGDIRAWGT